VHRYIARAQIEKARQDELTRKYLNDELRKQFYYIETVQKRLDETLQRQDVLSAEIETNKALATKEVQKLREADLRLLSQELQSDKLELQSELVKLKERVDEFKEWRDQRSHQDILMGASENQLGSDMDAQINYEDGNKEVGKVKFFVTSSPVKQAESAFKKKLEELQEEMKADLRTLEDALNANTASTAAEIKELRGQLRS